MDGRQADIPVFHDQYSRLAWLLCLRFVGADRVSGRRWDGGPHDYPRNLLVHLLVGDIFVYISRNWHRDTQLLPL